MASPGATTPVAVRDPALASLAVSRREEWLRRVRAPAPASPGCVGTGLSSRHVTSGSLEGDELLSAPRRPVASIPVGGLR
jgi:hypothetical protein